MENKESYSLKKSESMSCPANDTLSDTIARVYEQIEIDCYQESDKKLVKEIALNIAVVYRLPDNAVIKIASNSLSAKDVKEIFSLLSGEHIDFVIEIIKKCRKYPLSGCIYTDGAFQHRT